MARVPNATSSPPPSTSGRLAMLKQDIQELTDKGFDLLTKEAAVKLRTGRERSKKAQSAPDDAVDPNETAFKMGYQGWYTRALPLVRQLLPDRYDDFRTYYRIEKRKDIDLETYTISDYLLGISISRAGAQMFSPFGAMLEKFVQQINIVKSALDRLDSALSDIRGLVEAELYDSELAVARDLLKKGHLRASGAVAGVTLEGHLRRVSSNHNIKLAKKDPTIADFNEALKADGTLDIPNWRNIQRLADLRNLCVHVKERDPTRDEVDELIRGADKVLKSVF